MVFTEPPYNVPIDGHAMGQGLDPAPRVLHGVRRDGRGAIHRVPWGACSLLAQNSRDGAIHFVCMDWRHMAMLAAGTAVYSELKRTCAFG